MTVHDFKEKLRENNFPELLLDQLQRGGLGDEIMQEQEHSKDNKVSITALLEWVHVMEHGIEVIKKLASIFERGVEVLEQYNEYFRLRVLKQDKSIGFVFGLMESNKEKFNINEYSASSSTLEQIFQNFAKMSIERSYTGEEKSKFPMLFKKDPT